MSIVAYSASLDAYINTYSKHLICQLSPTFAFLFFSTHVELILSEYSSAPRKAAAGLPADISEAYLYFDRIGDIMHAFLHYALM